MLFHNQNKKKKKEGHIKEELSVQIFTDLTVFIAVSEGGESRVHRSYRSLRLPGGVQEGGDGGRLVDHQRGEVRGH